MLSNIVPYRGMGHTLRVVFRDTALQAWVMERLMPELCVPTLDGEDREQARVRHAAAADILRELLAEYSAAAEEVAA